jgi:hypothetical protein
MLQHQTGPWLVSGVLDGGYGWYTSQRQIAVGTTTGQANGSPGVAHAGLHLRADYLVSFGDGYVKPNITIAAVYRHMSSYTETGSTPFNLDVKSSSDVVGSITPMVEFGRSSNLAGMGVFRAFAGVGAGFYINNDWQTVAGLSLAPDAGRITTTSRLPNAVAKVNAGFNLFTVGGVEAKVTYSAQVAPGYSSQAVMGRLGYTF